MSSTHERLLRAEVQRHVSALATNPGDTRAFEALQEAYFLSADWEKLVALYRHRLDDAGLTNPRQRAALHHRLGQILEERCLDVDLAIEQYTGAIQTDPSFRPALRQLRQVHANRDAWDLVLQIAEVEIGTLSEPYDRASFFAEMGDVWLRRIHDPTEATSCFEQALAIDPHQQDALAGMARTLEAQGQPEAAAATWERLIGCVRGPDRAMPLVSLAAILSGPLRQGERAVELYRRALGDDPRNEHAVEALSVAAAAREQWELLADLYERRFSLAAGAKRRTAIALEAGSMELEQRDNVEAARVWLERARELSSEDLTVLTSFIDLERKAGSTDALLNGLDRLVRVSGSATPMRLLLEAASLHTDRADDEQALVVLELAEQHSPDDPLVLEAMAATYSNLLRHDELAVVLERRASIEDDDPKSRATALVELGDLQASQLEDIAAAQDAYERAFAAWPDKPGIVSTLESLYRKTDSWDPLRGLLECACESGLEAERGGFHCSLGELLEEQYQDFEGSAACYEKALDSSPNPSALQGLRRLAELSNDPDAMLRALEREARGTTDPARLAEISLELSGRFEQSSDFETALAWAERALATAPGRREHLEAVAALQERLGREDDLTRTLTNLDEVLSGPDRAAVRRRIAALSEIGGDGDTALTWWEGALETEPDDLTSLAALRRHYRICNRSEDLAPVLRKLAELAPRDEQAAVLGELCTLLDEQLSDLDGAIVVLWRLVQTPGRPENAYARLGSLLERAGRFEELAQHLLESRRALPDDSQEAIEIDLRRAQLLLDPLGQFEQAAHAFRAVRMRAPDRADATEGLERALRAANDAAGLTRLLAEIAEQCDDAERRERLHFERAVLLEESLGELEQARQAYTSLCAADASPAMATQAGARLESLLERCGDWGTLRTRLETAVAQATARDKCVLHERIARLCQDRMGDQEGCAEHLEEAGRLEPDRPDAWRQLASLYQELDLPDDLLRVTQAELETGPDPEREAVLQARTAALWIQRPGEEDRACAHFERLLELEPGRSDATQFLVARYEEEGGFAHVVQLLERRLAAVARPEQTPAEQDPNRGLRTSLRLRIATLKAEELDDPEGAIAMLEPALSDGGASGPAAEPLAHLYEAVGRNDDLVALCEAAIQACHESERSSWLLRLADCLSVEGQEAGAASAYREVLDERPHDVAAYTALCDLYRRGGEQAAPLAELLESRLLQASGPEEIAIRMELAQLLGEALARPADALGQLKQVIELEGDHEAAFQHALRLSDKLGRHDEQMQLIDARLELRVSAQERVDLLERRAVLLAGPIESPEAAAAAYREVIALDPERRSARRSLREVLEGLGRWTAVLDCLYVDADGADREERAAIYERAVEVATAHVGQDAALPWLERLRAVRPDDPLVVARIADVHRLAGRFESVLRALEDELALTSNVDHKRDLHLGRARILERDMHAPGRAITALEVARSLAPDDASILEKLDDLYDVTGRAKDRAEVIEERIAGISQGATPLRLHLDAAQLYSETLGDPAGAIPHLLRAVLLTRTLTGGVSDGPVSTPEARAALLTNLAGTLRQNGREEAWARASEAELRLLQSDRLEHPAQDDDPRVARCNELHRDLARSYTEILANQRAALDHMRTLLDHARDAAPVGLTSEEVDHLECACLDLLRRDSSWVELEGRLSARAERGAGSPEEWLELARLRDERLHAPRAALLAYARSLALRPASLPAIRGLRDLSERLADWAEMARALELELALEGHWSPRELAALSHRLGEVCWRRLGATERATRAYRDALEADPGDLESLRALQELYELQESWESAAELYEREVGILGDEEPDRRKHVSLAAAGIARNHLDDPDRAMRNYESAADASPLLPEDLRAQAELYRQVGAREKFAAAYAQWCDDERAGATSEEHLALVEVLVDLGRQDEALARAQRAVAVNARDVDAWAAVARLHQDRGQSQKAADALHKAGELRYGPQAAEDLRDAALLVETSDPEACANRLRRATEMDPGCASAHAHLARVALALECWQEAEETATRGLDLSAAAEAPLPDALLLETALSGGRAARAQDRLESAILFFAAALDLDEANQEALEAYGELLFERGDLAAARSALEDRLEQGAHDRHAEWLTMLGSVLELAGESSAALERFREAVRADPARGAGHAGVARICEQTGRIDEAIEAFEGWANAARGQDDPAGSAARLLRAAEIELAHGHVQAAESHLRSAVEAAPENARAWVLLAELLADADRVDQLLELVPDALSNAAVLLVDDAVARLALLRARALEEGDDPSTACDAYAQAVARDSRCAEAALAQARLLRAQGEWAEAAQSLRDFCDHHPEPEHRDLAEAYYKLAGLLSGPLEDMDGAIRCFERTLELAPDHPKAREPLASLLAVMPHRWTDAIVHHAELLDEKPTRTASYRSLQQIALSRENIEASRFGLAVLRALGAASPAERAQAPDFLPRPVIAQARLEDPIAEIARRLVQHVAETIPGVLQADTGQDEGEDATSSSSADDFATRFRSAEGDVAIAGLEVLSDEALGDLLATLTALALGEESDEELLESSLDDDLLKALESGLGRWTRRKMRRLLDGTTLKQVRALDPGAWRIAVRGLAATVAVDLGHGDLRSALVYFCTHEFCTHELSTNQREDRTIADADDLTARIAGSAIAEELLRRVAASWCQELVRS